VGACRQIGEMRGHRSRVSSLSWNGPLVSSGSRDASIHHYDVRAPQQAAELHGHTQEVCGLKWSPQGTQLASGGNDNILNIWEARRNQSRFTIARHQAAVKALAWCPPHPTRPFALFPRRVPPSGPGADEPRRLQVPVPGEPARVGRWDGRPPHLPLEHRKRAVPQ
jgi:hypothetical protein